MDKGCDNEVLTQLKNYANILPLSESDYTIGLHFIIWEEDEPAEKVRPFDKTKYRNFLFDLNVIEKAIVMKRTFIYY
ncbi:MAG TPA: hypothetical protein VGM63_10565 [Mucilaginibacter sp.]